jgi:hypothetical protein
MFRQLTPDLLDLTATRNALAPQTFGVWDDLCGGPLCSSSSTVPCLPPPSGLAE